MIFPDQAMPYKMEAVLLIFLIGYY